MKTWPGLNYLSCYGSTGYLTLGFYGRW